MIHHVLYVSFAKSDRHFYDHLAEQLRCDGHRVAEYRVDAASLVIETVSAIIALLSPDGITSESVLHACICAQQHDLRLIPLLIHFTESLPHPVDKRSVIDVTNDFSQAYEQVLSRLPTVDQNLTLGHARDAYLNRAMFKSQHTLDSYRRAIELFFIFLDDRTFSKKLPIHKLPVALAEESPLKNLSEEDTPILLHFALWLLSPFSGKTGNKRPYKIATVELRVAGVQNWFQFMDEQGWLPKHFNLAEAKRLVQDELHSKRPERNKPIEPFERMEDIIAYYDTQSIPKHLRKPDANPARIQQWELTRLRNRALLHCLAESGGRISEVLSLNLEDFPEHHFSKHEVLLVDVMGKGGHTYQLRFLDSLPAIRDYIRARHVVSQPSKAAVFVSHDPCYDGNRMSRVVAWRVIQRAARGLGVSHITPNDFRHWRATQLVNAGYPPDVVQDYLGHRSMDTTRAYYTQTDTPHTRNNLNHLSL